MCGNKVVYTSENYDGMLLLGNITDETDSFPPKHAPQYVLLDASREVVSWSDAHTEDLICIVFAKPPRNAPDLYVPFGLRAEFTADVQDFGLVQHRGVINMWHKELKQLSESNKLPVYTDENTAEMECVDYAY